MKIAPRYLKAQEAAEYLGISLSTFWRGISDERFPLAIEVTPRTHRWDRIELDLAMARIKAEKDDGKQKSRNPGKPE